MTDLINGRTPEEIKRNLSYLVRCENCPQNHEYGCDYDKQTEECRTVNDALALIERLEATLERFGEFRKPFEEYTGCPRGATGRAALPIEEEVLAMKPIRDVDHGEWIPVNADALRELVAKYKQLRDAAPKWISVKERLPVKQLRVIVQTGHGLVTTGWRSYHVDVRGGELWEVDEAHNYHNDVTHWMPTPEPKENE